MPHNLFILLNLGEQFDETLIENGILKSMFMNLISLYVRKVLIGKNCWIIIVSLSKKIVIILILVVYFRYKPYSFINFRNKRLMLSSLPQMQEKFCTSQDKPDIKKKSILKQKRFIDQKVSTF